MDVYKLKKDEKSMSTEHNIWDNLCFAKPLAYRNNLSKFPSQLNYVICKYKHIKSTIQQDKTFAGATQLKTTFYIKYNVLWEKGEKGECVRVGQEQTDTF
jgi:hypothetical protein